MKKILIISDVPTHPKNEGCNVRVYNLINNMKELNFDVYFLFVYRRNRDCNISDMKKFIGKEKIFIYKYNKYKKFLKPKFLFFESIRKLLKTIGLGKKIIIHYKVDDDYFNSLNKYIKKLNSRYSFNIAWVEYVWLSKALNNFNDNTLKVIDTLDIYANRENVYLKNNQFPQGRYYTEQEEKKGLSRANYVIAIQNNEERYFSQGLKNGVKTVTVGNFIRLFKPNVVHNKKYIFVGSNNDLNIYSVNYFINNVLPIVKEKDSNSVFIIVGGVCKSVPDSDNYIKLGYVDNLDEVYNDARLVINPIMSGTGLNIKTIEALGYSKPLVSTTCGIKGLEFDKKIAEIADDDKMFAEKIINVLNDDELAKELSNNAFEFSNNYNKEIINNLKEILYKK